MITSQDMKNAGWLRVNDVLDCSTPEVCSMVRLSPKMAAEGVGLWIYRGPGVAQLPIKAGRYWARLITETGVRLPSEVVRVDDDGLVYFEGGDWTSLSEVDIGPAIEPPDGWDV